MRLVNYHPYDAHIDFIFSFLDVSAMYIIKHFTQLISFISASILMLLLIPLLLYIYFIPLDVVSTNF